MRVAIADDHRLMREMLSDNVRRLGARSADIEILEVGSYEELHTAGQSGPTFDLILLDFHMPGVNGIPGVTRVLEAFPTTPVMVISGTVDPKLALQCVQAGAAGFVPKTVSSTALRNAINVVLDGERYIHAFALSGSSDPSEPLPPAVSPEKASGPRWSEREAQTLDLLISGKTNKQIARELQLQEMTVKTHVRNIYRKLGAVNRADAVRMVLESRNNN